jgi:hypothetical protein
MKLVWLCLLPVVLLAGCAQKGAPTPTAFQPVPGPSRPDVSLPPPPPPVVATNPPAPSSRTSAASRKPAIVTPDTAITGKVVKFNDTARIVVLEFSIVNMPAADRQLFIYRNDLKVGEVKTSRWQKDQHIVADLISGEAQAGDVVRDR